ncbi:MAG TPA: hypothetical protein PLO37_00090 [Candidatus Hydrogenedentes bacterium]|nr:hypothetical protein [Candidatus Hydrogenedentota bacterium]HPG65211.1 hypothetical protein [Candidatus Hydrogenedentota bacterium]
MTIQCCKCRLYKDNDTWTATPPETTDHVSHGFCPACMKEQLAEFEEHREAVLRYRKMALRTFHDGLGHAVVG